MIRKFVSEVTQFTIIILTCSVLPPLADGEAAERYFEFAIRNHEASENFVAITSDSTVIGLLEEQLELPEADRNLHITGPLEFGDGGHNTGWAWHFVPNEWTLAEMSVELCDGWSSGVESDLSYWLDTVGTFCPWDSHVLREIIYLGDVDDNEAIELKDLVTVMRAAAGKEAEIRAPEADVNGDHQIGLAEAVYILRKLSGLI